jgi:nucleoside-diphosphate kinase
MGIQSTLAIIKPNCFCQSTEILSDILSLDDITVSSKYSCTLTLDEIGTLYKSYTSQSWFSKYVKLMMSNSVMLIVLEGDDVITRWRNAIGPTDPNEARKIAHDTLRSKYGGDTIEKNGFHGSDSIQSSKIEIDWMKSVIASRS